VPICEMLSGQVGRGSFMVLRPATFSQDGSHGGMQGLEGLRSSGDDRVGELVKISERDAALTHRFVS
jgi:hypothetical protein